MDQKIEQALATLAWLAGGILAFVQNYQTLIAGVLAIAAAFIARHATLKAAELPLEEKRQHIAGDRERRRAYSCRLLANEFTWLSLLAMQAGGTIRVTVAANAEISDKTRARLMLPLPHLTNEWETMSLLSVEATRRILAMQRGIQQHNFDMERAGGSFGDSNFQVQVEQRADELSRDAKNLAAHLSREAEDKEARWEDSPKFQVASRPRQSTDLTSRRAK